MKNRFALALLVLLPLAAYVRSLRYPFLDFDDPIYVTQSPIIRSPGASGLLLAWKRPYFHDYIPLTHSSLWLDARIAGLTPIAFRLENLAWHILAALFLLRAARGWIGDEGEARLVALLFAVHPMAVESVAWIASRKNVLSLPLFLCAILAWMKGEESGRSLTGRVAAGALFVLSLLAKSASVGFPLVVFAGSWLLRRRRLARATLDALPYGVLAAAYLLFALRLRHDLPEEPLAGPLGMVAVDLQVLARYLVNSIAPVRLSAFYYVDLGGFSAPATWLSLVLLPAGIAVPFVWLRRRREACFALIWVIAGLLPALNLVPQPHPVADRFFYWSLPGLLVFFVLAASDGLAAVSARKRFWEQPSNRALVLGTAGGTSAPGVRAMRSRALLAGAAVAGLTVLTGVRAGAWRSSLSLFEDAARKSPRSSVAHMHLGNVLSNSPSEADKGRAALEFERMLACPDSDRALKQVAKDGAAVFLARMEFVRGEKGRADERISRQFRGRESTPEVALLLAQYELATGRPESVIARLEPGVQALPGINKLGRTLLAAPEMPYRYGAGRLSRTSDVYLASQQREGLVRALSLLGKAYLQSARPEDAAASLSIVAALSQPSPEMLRDLARAYQAAGYAGRAQQALDDAEELASRLRPVSGH